MERMTNFGAIPVLDRLSAGMHLAFHRDLKICVETFLPVTRQNAIRYRENYLPRFDDLMSANSKLPPKNQMVERNAYISEADIRFRQIRKVLDGLATDNKDTVTDAKTLRKIVKSYDILLSKKSIARKFANYPKLIARLREHSQYLESVGLRILVEELSRAIEDAEAVQGRIVMVRVENKKFPVAGTRRKIDVAYRSLMMALNASKIIGEDVSDTEIFRTKWSELLLSYRTAFATKEGARIKRVGESEVESAKKKERYYTLPKPKTYIAPKAKAASSGDGGNDIVPPVIPPASEIPLYDPNKHFTEYKLGDLVRIDNGDIYMVINLGHVHYHPDSKYGHYGWKLVG